MTNKTLIAHYSEHEILPRAADFLAGSAHQRDVHRDRQYWSNMQFAMKFGFCFQLHGCLACESLNAVLWGAVSVPWEDTPITFWISSCLCTHLRPLISSPPQHNFLKHWQSEFLRPSPRTGAGTTFLQTQKALQKTADYIQGKVFHLVPSSRADPDPPCPSTARQSALRWSITLTCQLAPCTGTRRWSRAWEGMQGWLKQKTNTTLQP